MGYLYTLWFGCRTGCVLEEGEFSSGGCCVVVCCGGVEKSEEFFGWGGEGIGGDPG